MRKIKLWSIFIIILGVMVSLFALVPAVYGFEGRGGNEVIIEAGETIKDDFYVGANRFVLEGTIDGDLLVGAREIVINGTVTGDVWGGAQSITINGSIEDDAHLAGAILRLGPNAQINDDLLASGYGIEMSSGSSVGGDLVAMSYQTLMAGQIEEGAVISSNAVAIRGTISEELEASVGDPDQQKLPFSAFRLMPNMPAIETLSPGLTIAETAKIDGNLIYKSPEQVNIPAKAVAGEVQYEEIQAEASRQEQKAPQRTPMVGWLLNPLKKAVALIIVASLIAWLFSGLIKAPVEALKAKPGASVGVGALIFFLFPLAIFLIILVFVLLALLFSFVGLGNLVGMSVLIGLTVLMLLIVAYIIALAYLAKIILGLWLGKLILSGLNPEGEPNLFLATILGVLLVVVLISVPWFGWLLSFTVNLFGLGALWFSVFKK